MGLPIPIQVEHFSFESWTEVVGLNTAIGRRRTEPITICQQTNTKREKNEPLRSQLHKRPWKNLCRRAMANEIYLRGGRAQLTFHAKASCRSNASNLAVKVVVSNGKEGGVNVPLSGGSRVDAPMPNRDMFLRPRPTHQCPPSTTTPFSMRHKEDLCGGLCAVLKRP
jgi:hypothetical protein